MMAAEFRGPPPLRMEENLPENWRRFKQGLEFYLTASGAETKTDKVRTSLMLHFAGEEAIEVYNTFIFDTDADKMKYEVVSQKFENYCIPRRNITYERNRFFTHNQTTESIDQYVTELRKRASSCEFAELTNSIIKDRIICGIKDITLKERLMRISDLNLEKALDICRVAEATETHMQEINGEKSVQAIKKRQPNPQKQHMTRQPSVGIQGAQGRKYERRTGDASPAHSRSACSYCGGFHAPRSCPAFGKQCNYCHAFNHFASRCRNKGTQKRNVPNKNYSVQNLDTEAEQEFFIGELHINSLSNAEEEKWTQKLSINDQNVIFKLDTGAQVNVLPKLVFERVRKQEFVQTTNAKISGYSGTSVPVVGKVNMMGMVKNRQEKILFYVVDLKADPIIGKQDCERLGFISRIYAVSNEYDHLIKEFSDVFSGIGCLEKPYQIRIKPNAEPVVNPPRRVPEAIKDRLKVELERMVENGIITSVDNPTEWLHNPVVVEKPNGQLRVCLDPKDLNEAIIKEPFVIPTLPEMSAKLKGAKFFSILDANSGFWQIQLTEDSSDLCAFNTPFGKYKFLRMPFGISSAPEVFQKVINDLFGDLVGVDNYFDDIIVTGTTKEEHDRNLRETLKRSREKNLKLNVKKCQMGAERIKFLGHYLSKNGIEVDPSKTEAILKMKVPENKKDLERFLGMVTFLAKFIPNLSEETAPLRILQKSDIEWHWTDSQNNAFERLKEILSCPPVLKFFNADLPVKISVDASKDGIGAVLLQNDCPISYASRALTSSEKNYAQIEKEMLAIVYGAERFHQFVYGRTLQVESDHKPLAAIFKKPLAQAPPRLQRFLLRLQKYQLKVGYKPGKELLTDDTLSRAFLEFSDLDEETQIQVHELNIEVEAQVKLANETLPISEERRKTFQDAARKDKNLTELTRLIREGWPEKVSQIPEYLRCYRTFRDEITCRNGLLFKGNKLIVPSSLQSEMLDRLHETHMGNERTKEKAKECLYWSTMYKDIEKKVLNCNICAEHQKSNTKEPLSSHEIPMRPWQKIGTDLFEWNKKQYLVLVDYYSKYVEVAILEKTRSEDVITNMKSIFARHGIPDAIVSDNGPQFSSREFSSFMSSWGIQHLTSSPEYPKSNGMAERTVQSVKNMLKKSKDPYLGLLDLRNTPFKDLEASPAQMLMGRRLKSNIPISSTLLQPETAKHSDIHEKLLERQKKQKNYYDRNAKPLSTFKTGDEVRIQRKGTWHPATVSRTVAPRSYIVKANGRELRRNRVHLRPSYGYNKQHCYEDDEDFIQPNQVPDPRPDPKVVTTRSGRVIRKIARYRD